MRDIKDILYFRTDISPFLVHLTRKRKGVYPSRPSEEDVPPEEAILSEEDMPAKQVLEQIIEEQRLVPGDLPISDARFGINTLRMSTIERRNYFAAVSFTETPLAEVHCLLEIAHRKVDLEPYGLVFLKDRLRAAGVMPVWYLNNERGDQDGVASALCSLIKTHPKEAEQILPLIAVFGRRLQPPGAAPQGGGVVDFSWEREWRWPAAKGAFEFTKKDVFIGLCPHSQISSFERLYPPVRFIDPRLNMKWYASELVQSRRRLQLKFSVV